MTATTHEILGWRERVAEVERLKGLLREILMADQDTAQTMHHWIMNHRERIEEAAK